jgi:low temperature requirement protein LtrA
VYTWAHAPIIAGIIAVAAAVEEILLHPSDPLPAEFRTMFVVGFGLTIFGITAAVFRAWRVVARERVAALVAVAVIAAVAGSWDGIWFLIAADIVLFIALLVEHLRVERSN